MIVIRVLNLGQLYDELGNFNSRFFVQNREMDLKFDGEARLVSIVPSGSGLAIQGTGLGGRQFNLPLAYLNANTQPFAPIPAWGPDLRTYPVYVAPFVSPNLDLGPSTIAFVGSTLQDLRDAYVGLQAMGFADLDGLGNATYENGFLTSVVESHPF